MKLESDFIIPFIYVQDCPECERMGSYLETLCEKYDCKLQPYDSETEKAVEVGVKHGIDDLPGCVIGDLVIKGEVFSKNLLETAIQQWKLENGIP